MNVIDQQDPVAELVRRWRARARTFMDDAERSSRHDDIVRLTAMASTLEWASSEVTWFEPPPSGRALPADVRNSSKEG
jgi:hypothetical protein